MSDWENMTAEELYREIIKRDEKHSDIEREKQHFNQEREEEDRFIDEQIKATEHMKYEYCTQDDREIIQLIDEEQELLGAQRNRNMSCIDDFEKEIRLAHMRVKDEENELNRLRNAKLFG